MTRPAAIARRVTRRTLSRQMAETLADTAIKRGCTAAIVYPDGVRIELTPARATEQADEGEANPFVGFQ